MNNVGNNRMHELQNANKDELLKLIAHDSLTGLLNRTSFSQDLADLMERKKPGALIFLDVNKFKQINDLSGHAIGDLMLQRASCMFSSVLPKPSLISRWSGDEFCFYLHDLSLPHVKLVISNLMNHVKSVSVVGANTLHQLSVSLGVVYFDCESRPAMQELINKADFAMYKAKKNNLGVVYVDLKNEFADEFLFAGLSFNQILAKNVITLDYQPIVDLDTNSPVASEALLRFYVGGERFLPENFIDYCESSGVIFDLDKWVLSSVIDRINQADECIHVNLSALTIDEKNYSQQVLDMLRKVRKPQNLVIEIIETQLLNLNDDVCFVLSEIRNMGIKIAIDDFGSGYSSFKTLLLVHVDYLKIDGSLILQLASNKKVQAYMQALSLMSKNGFQFKLIAEFIESFEVKEICRKYGIHYGQGFFFGKPKPADAEQC